MGAVNFAGGNLTTYVDRDPFSRNSPQPTVPNSLGVAERALGLIETAAMAGRIQAREVFPGAQLPATESLCGETSHWACDALNRTATSAYPANKSPHETWYGNPRR